MGELKNYDPKQVSVIAAGRSIGGFADGSFISVVRNAPMFTKVRGADGEIARTKSNDRSGRITVTLMQTSADNAFFNGLALADEISGSSTFPILVRDALGTYVANCADAWVEQLADSEFGKELTNRVWNIECSELDVVGGGN